MLNGHSTYICRNTSEAITMHPPEKWDIIITPHHGLFHINFKEIWEHRDLVYLFVRRDFVSKFKQTILGPLWFLLQPVFTMLIYMLVFGNIARISTAGLPPALFYLAGITIWNYFSDCFLATSNTFVVNQNIFGKVYFPRITVPLSVVISNLLKFFIQFILFIGVLMWFLIQGAQVSVQWTALWWVPLLILQMAIMGMGMGMVFSSLSTKYRDLQFLITFGVQLLMYATPVIYPLTEVPLKYSAIIQANPLAPVVETFRYLFTGKGMYSLELLAYSWLATLFVFFMGMLVFNKTEKYFIDTV